MVVLETMTTAMAGTIATWGLFWIFILGISISCVAVFVVSGLGLSSRLHAKNDLPGCGPSTASVAVGRRSGGSMLNGDDRNNSNTTPNSITNRGGGCGGGVTSDRTRKNQEQESAAAAATVGAAARDRVGDVDDGNTVGEEDTFTLRGKFGKFGSFVGRRNPLPPPTAPTMMTTTGMGDGSSTSRSSTSSVGAGVAVGDAPRDRSIRTSAAVTHLSKPNPSSPSACTSGPITAAVATTSPSTVAATTAAVASTATEEKSSTGKLSDFPFPTAGPAPDCGEGGSLDPSVERVVEVTVEKVFAKIEGLSGKLNLNQRREEVDDSKGKSRNNIRANRIGKHGRKNISGRRLSSGKSRNSSLLPSSSSSSSPWQSAEGSSGDRSRGETGGVIRTTSGGTTRTTKTEFEQPCREVDEANRLRQGSSSTATKAGKKKDTSKQSHSVAKSNCATSLRTTSGLAKDGRCSGGGVGTGGRSNSQILVDLSASLEELLSTWGISPGLTTGPAGEDNHPSHPISNKIATLPHHQAPGGGSGAATAVDICGTHVSGGTLSGGSGSSGGVGGAPSGVGTSFGSYGGTPADECSRYGGGGGVAAAVEFSGGEYSSYFPSLPSTSSSCTPATSFDGPGNSAAEQYLQQQQQHAAAVAGSQATLWPHTHTYLPACKPYDLAPRRPVVGPAVTPLAPGNATGTSTYNGPSSVYCFPGDGGDYAAAGGWGGGGGSSGGRFSPALPLPRPAFGSSSKSRSVASAPAQHLATLRDLLAGGSGGGEGDHDDDGVVLDDSDDENAGDCDGRAGGGGGDLCAGAAGVAARGGAPEVPGMMD